MRLVEVFARFLICELFQILGVGLLFQGERARYSQGLGLGLLEQGRSTALSNKAGARLFQV